MGKFVVGIRFEPGKIIIQMDSGPAREYLIANVIRLLDIPLGLDQTQITAITALANFLVILIRTLIDRGILDEDFADELGLDIDLNHLIYAIEQMGGAYHKPELKGAGTGD